MSADPTPDPLAGWRPLRLTRDLARLGADGRRLQRSVASGESVRLRRGVVVDAGNWADVADDARYLLRVRAVAATRKSAPVFSHQSAAIIWGLPIIGRWPDPVHLMAAGRTGLHSKNGVILHHDRLRDDDVVEIDGMLVTSLIRTLVDLACTTSFLSAVATLDRGTGRTLVTAAGRPVDGVSREEVLERLAGEGPRRGARAALKAVLFSDNRSGSPGESLSRGQIHLCGFPAPELQVVFLAAAGQKDIVDFRWRQRQESRTLNLVGEFDGLVKYTRSKFTAGRSIEQIVWAEKIREDRLRAQGNGMARWTWDVALHADRLRALLIGAGLRPER